MKQIFDQFLHFLQQGIAAIFRFVQLVWNWSIDQITKVTHVPWEHWPLWKQILLVLVIAAVAYALYVAARELWDAALRVLTAFASFLAALVVTLPAIMAAGVIALAGLWVINNLNLDLSSMPKLTAFTGGNSASSNDAGNKQTSQPTDAVDSATTGSKP